MRRCVPLGVLTAILAGVVPPATAGTVDVSIVGVSEGFDPAVATASAGDAVRWTNDDSIQHTTTQDGPLALWASGGIDSGGTFDVTLTAAGTYPYHCSFHTQMTGRIRVPVTAAPAAGDLDTTFLITIASEAAQEGFVFDVQKRRGDGRWKLWKEAITKARARFHPRADAAYAFRARLRELDVGSSGWSPRATISVSS
jgi:plastocyanin